MNEKNFPDDNNTLSLEELTNEASDIVEILENEKDLENSIENYQKLIKLNNLIEKKFSKNSKKITEETRKKIKEIVFNKMQNKLTQIANDTNKFLKSFIQKQKKTDLIAPIKYGLFSGGKKIRSKIIIDIGHLFNINYKTLIMIGSAVECIHAYSLIHDDLPCMDNDKLRRGKPSTHFKFGEATALLAGSSLLTMAFEILSSTKLNIKKKDKIVLIEELAKCSGHLGLAGGQFLDLNFEHKKVSQKKIIEMQIKKTGKLFSFCCIAPAIIKNKKISEIKSLEKVGFNIGLLFQIADDLIDYSGSSKIAGKKTKKDQKKGKATLISLLKYKNTIKYTNKIKMDLDKKLKKYGSKTKNINETIEYILNRNK